MLGAGWGGSAPHRGLAWVGSGTFPEPDSLAHTPGSPLRSRAVPGSRCEPCCASMSHNPALRWGHKSHLLPRRPVSPGDGVCCHRCHACLRHHLPASPATPQPQHPPASETRRRGGRVLQLPSWPCPRPAEPHPDHGEVRARWMGSILIGSGGQNGGNQGGMGALETGGPQPLGF